MSPQPLSQKRLLLLMPATTYRASDFLSAAHRLGAEVVVGSDLTQILEEYSGGSTLTLDFDDTDRAIEQVRAVAPFDAIIGVDEESVGLAAAISAALKLPHNPVGAVDATRNKARSRQILRDANLPIPRFEVIGIDDDPVPAAERVGYPCVVKPLILAASQGVIRADDGPGVRAAAARTAAILRTPTIRKRGTAARQLLIEAFLPGKEVALEGLLRNSQLDVLALFDKPDPLDGPFFEETLYVTPSRLPQASQLAIADCSARAARALGLVDGPIHAELRLNEHGPWLLEVAARSIGGLCSRALRFGTGWTLEEVIIRHALGMDLLPIQREQRAAGVMMIPIPRAGKFVAARGRDAARAVPGIEEVTILVRRGQHLVPLPEGSRYLGFILARDETPEMVEAALRTAHGCLEFVIAAE